jgi:hypothetical protein
MAHEPVGAVVPGLYDFHGGGDGPLACNQCAAERFWNGRPERVRVP